MKRLVPLWQIDRCNHEPCQVLGVGEGDHLVTSGARNGGRLVADVYREDQRSEVRLNMGQAVVVEEECVVELRPFEVRLAEDFEGFFSQAVVWYAQRSSRGCVSGNLEIVRELSELYVG